MRLLRKRFYHYIYFDEMIKKVLLVGEYSGVYTELAKGLKSRGIDVFSINDGDGYKKYPADYKVWYGNQTSYRYINKILFRLGIKNCFSFIKQWRQIKKIAQGYDVVQIINPVPFSEWGSVLNYVLFRYIKKHNRCIFLSVLGFDYYVMRWYYNNCNASGFYTPSLKKKFFPDYAFKYLYIFFYKTLNDYAVKVSEKLIPGLPSYKSSYEWTGKVSNVIPFPIGKDKLGTPLNVNPSGPIIIFHGWQLGKENFKGNDVIDNALRKIETKYRDKVQYVVVSDVSFDEYIRLFSNCHIFVDQLYERDKGMNAVLGMAAGKVVLSGFQKEALAEYPNYINNEIGIPIYNLNEKQIYEVLCQLIDNPYRIEEISKNALEFVKSNHLTEIVTDLYMKTWQSLNITQ